MKANSSLIDTSAIIHPSVSIGEYSVIGANCIIEANTVIGHHCVIKPGTYIGARVKFDDYSNTSGAVWIGNDVYIKRMSCITQGTIIEDKVFIGPGIMIIHEKNVSFQRNVEKISHGVHIRSGAIIGGRATLNAGITVGMDAIVGAGAVVTKDCEEGGIYVGLPAKKIAEVPVEERIGEDQLQPGPSHIGKYLPEMQYCGKLKLES